MRSAATTRADVKPNLDMGRSYLTHIGLLGYGRIDRGALHSKVYVPYMVRFQLDVVPFSGHFPAVHWHR